MNEPRPAGVLDALAVNRELLRLLGLDSLTGVRAVSVFLRPDRMPRVSVELDRPAIPGAPGPILERRAFDLVPRPELGACSLDVSDVRLSQADPPGGVAPCGRQARRGSVCPWWPGVVRLMVREAARTVAAQVIGAAVARAQLGDPPAPAVPVVVLGPEGVPPCEACGQHVTRSGCACPPATPTLQQA